MSDKPDLKLNLPYTNIPMKAGLNQREPEILKTWESRDLYKKIRVSRKGRKTFHLHDGPPYANGQIHLGHAVNKVLKDIVIKSKTLSGFDAPYIPGWDCHGLPIELQVEKKIGSKKKTISQEEFRSLCREYAGQQIELQKLDFIRLGVLGEWNDRYASLDKSFEADAIDAFSRIYHNGHVEKGFKPVHWCLECSSALAEAEVEYIDKTSNSIDVKFSFSQSSIERIQENVSKDLGERLSLVIWTTTPWTIPGNQAVCLNEKISYTILEVDDEKLVVASELVDQCSERWSEKKIKILVPDLVGSVFSGTTVVHPIFKKEVAVLSGEHVTTETGTGFVHTAPAHGVDDFNVCQANNIEPFNPISMNGCFKEEIEFFAGVHVRKVENLVIDKLKELGSLVNLEDYNHSYPHCWRHKTPLIFMATPQWFISMTKSGLLDGTMKAVSEIDFIPSWGKERMEIMLKDRPDWCISRQRDWGIPITLVYEKDSGELHSNQSEIFNLAASAIRDKGIDSWSNLEVEGVSNDYKKSKDIFDVWFDSGVTHFCVMDKSFGPNVQSDLYLEGSDQHRGWFQSSLLTSIAMKGMAPYKSVLTHGFVVDEDGRKMSKSLGNVVSPQEIIAESGADILRFWIASTDFRGEMSFSKDIFNRSIDGFRRIRNTLRFMVSNLYDFGKEFNSEDLLFLDKAMIVKANHLQKDVAQHYEEYNFHLVISKVLNFCVNDLGGLYLDVIKDRLYTMKADSIGRKSAQYALDKILTVLVKSISPILCFTAYEFSEEMNPKKGHEIFFSEWDESILHLNDSEEKKLTKLLALRTRVYQAIESERQKGDLKNALDANIEITLRKDDFEDLKEFKEEIHKLFIASSCELNIGKEEEIKITKSNGQKCARCWHKVDELSDKNICSRCDNNINGNGEDRGFF